MPKLWKPSNNLKFALKKEYNIKLSNSDRIEFIDSDSKHSLLLQSGRTAVRKRREIRAELFKLNPYCPNCGILMVLPDDFPHSIKSNGTLPENTCTYEHIHSKWSPNRRRYNKPAILCRKCNGEKGSQDQRDYLLIQNPLLIKLKEDIDTAYEKAMKHWNAYYNHILYKKPNRTHKKQNQ